MTWKKEIKKQVDYQRKINLRSAKNNLKTVHQLLEGLAKKGFYDEDGKKYSIDYAINFLPSIIELLEEMFEEVEYPEEEVDEADSYDQQVMRRLREGGDYNEARVNLGSRR